MPNTKSAAKAIRKDKILSSRNSRVKTELRYLLKQTRRAVEKKDAGKAKEWLKKTIKAYDKARQNGVIKANTASRNKSRLTKAVNTLG